ncbi:conserved hypothetical protein, steroid delta-isomerase-related [Chitinophaga terrae (ex Kim and Jung 2007)]|uniref:Ester cyclase n=1 Tax=Chitinophaga terrae (ex Kim and Jung 2007) TaxID=408074 RepID=A0A1H4EH21_9BACT|nr:ester cyclase [Chitinophaga terrae (ex Kim and Jung 2007)]MDQ0109624.1 steroid delta-isomerase-like uncharacterized protein [Chitinophaga terrae (ex Kim and Jung 2007)]GEP91647.1 hypothetical protein CTE07_32920 [Chitinophaga terrae (ex Kim and Jung 2007)]SEA84374.1 conserved hypothetical protein, steroid delta-isomerase-related [Chitinophaga terrae (ex Kim and Jung 2007)]
MKNKYLPFLLIAMVAACTAPQPQKIKDPLEINRTIGQRYFEEVWNQGKVDLLDSLLAPGYINHTPSAPTVPGPEGLKPIVLAIRKAFPDLHYEIQDMIPAPGYLTMRVVMTGTQQDTLFGLPPTGKPVKVLQINIEKIVDGRIAEHWRVTDELTMMKQLGVVK